MFESHLPAPSFRVLSLIPPMTQLNTPYPSTAYLTGFLRSQGVDAVQEDLWAGRTENAWMSHQFSQELMGLLDEIRAQIGLTYPNE